MKGPGIGVGLELGANRIGTATVSRFLGWTRYTSRGPRSE
jgi:hypothetical protein